jgi:hypothetical protein
VREALAVSYIHNITLGGEFLEGGQGGREGEGGRGIMEKDPDNGVAMWTNGRSIHLPMPYGKMIISISGEHHG